MSITLPVLYPITDVKCSGMSHKRQVELLAAAGAKFVQLRDKSASPRDFYSAVVEAMEVARVLGVTVIINDRVDIALAAGADGVHLGQDDVPPSAARRLLGEDRIIGYSTHNIEQAIWADAEPVDYIAIGPVFQTSTKANPDPVVGLQGLLDVSKRVRKPVVAIGGITLEAASEVLAHGADSLAVISDLYSGSDLGSRVRGYLELPRTRRQVSADGS